MLARLIAVLVVGGAAAAGPLLCGEAQAQVQRAPAPAPAKPAGPQRIETIIYDSWQVTCHDTLGGTAAKQCSMRLQVVEPSRNQVVFTWIVALDARGVLMAEFQSPVGVQLMRGLELQMGNTPMRRFSFVTCTGQVCAATAAVDESFLSDAKGAETAVATVYTMDDRGVQFRMKMTGFEDAVAAVRR